MKIEEIRFNNHYLFGNSVINFNDAQGNPYDSVLLCGENGSGKTALIECLYNIANVPPKDYEIKYRLDTRDISIINANIAASNNQTAQANIINNLKSTIILRKHQTENHYVVEFDNGTVQTYGFYKSIDRNSHPLEYFLSRQIVKVKKNDKEPTFQKANAITKLRLDDEESRNSIHLAGDLNITQLLVDLQSQDANEFFNNSKGKTQVNQITYEERVNRLRHSFNRFFNGSIKLNDINNFDIQFENNGGKKFDISGLSSGEKSVVQYGGFFLKNQQANESFISFLDEPEQSLHPLWEEKILSFYKDILTIGSNQISQLFSITHSEYVVKNALNINCLIIIMKRLPNGTFTFNRVTQLNTFPFSPTYSEIKYYAFNLFTVDFHEELYAFLAQRENKNVKNLDSYFQTHSAQGKLWIGKRLDSTSGRVVPCSNLNTNTLPSFIRNYNHHPELRGTDNLPYSDIELKSSISFLLTLV